MLDFDDMVSLVQQDYLDHFTRSKLGPIKGPEASAHNMFKMKG